MFVNRSIALALLILLATVTAATLEVPAVDAQGGGSLTHIEAKAQPGKGNVYVAVEPLTGVDTQTSEKLAVKTAAAKAGVDASKFDVLFKITTTAEVVDGPSAGAALTLLAFSEFTGKPIRRDLALTGTIERDGKIGPIGGVFEKASAVGASHRYTVFLVPYGQRVQNGVDLDAYAQQKYGMQVVEVSDVDQLLQFAFNTTTGEKLVSKARVLPPLNLIPIEPSASQTPMKAISASMIASAQAQVDALPSSERNSVVRLQVNQALNNSRQALAKGYYYSAANTAFLAQVTLDELSMLNMSRRDFRKKLQDLQDQGDAYKASSPSQASWEWQAAASMRFYWANARLQSASDRVGILTPDYLLEDYALAKTWIEAGKALDGVNAASSSSPVNALKVRTLAENYLDQAEQLDADHELDEEGQEHLDATKAAFQNGDYLAAAFNAQFVLAYTDAEQDAQDATAGELLEQMCGENYSADSKCLQPKSYGSAWASLYYDHARYYVQEANRTGETAAALNALKLYKLANAVSEMFAETNEALSLPENATAPFVKPSNATATPTPSSLQIEVTSASQPDGLRNLIVASIVAIVAVLAILILLSRRSMRPVPSDKPTDYARRIERAEALMLEGKLSERNYEAIKSKYEPLLQSSQPRTVKSNRTGARKKI